MLLWTNKFRVILRSNFSMLSELYVLRCDLYIYIKCMSMCKNVRNCLPINFKI